VHNKPAAPEILAGEWAPNAYELDYLLFQVDYDVSDLMKQPGKVGKVSEME
jgi:hypothetical protein